MIKKILIWYLMLNKRLLKKKGFIIILVMIPILAFLVNHYIEKEDNGLIHIALATEDSSDEFANELIDELDEDSELIIYTVCNTEEEAKNMVKTSSADAAWIFTSDIDTKVKEIADGKKHQLINVYEIEDSVILKISREKIIGTVFPYISRCIYTDYVTNKLDDGSKLSQEDLEEYYNIFDSDESIIDFEFLDSSQANINEAKFLSAPIRGLLVVIMLLSGIAATMYFLEDEKRGTFSWLPINKGYFVLAGSNIAAVSISAIFVTLALILSNTYTSFLRETVPMILVVIMMATFCSALGAIFRNVNSMGIMVPTLMVISIVFCPVFFNTKIVGQEILPPYFYLYAVNDIDYYVYMIVYSLIMFIIGYIAYYLLRRKK